MIQEFIFSGKSLEELKTLDIKEFAKLLPSRQRRSLARGIKPEQKKLLQKLKISQKPVKTHLRNTIILPEMVGKNILIYNGKEFVPIRIEADMLGHYVGEFVLTRKSVKHSAPGIGATKSSAAVSVR
ncbi:30S ribosomal protein S19 [Candidatus Woesearchaeota archaeon]|nr:30S ribosomal protein S19 [Candidatus Woesearchaeota archaeon]